MNKIAPKENYNEQVRQHVLRTRAQAAEYLTICQRSLDYLCETGRLPFIRIGRRVVFYQSDLDQFLQANRIGAKG